MRPCARRATTTRGDVVENSSQLSAGTGKALFNGGTVRQDFIGKQIFQADLLENEIERLVASVREKWITEDHLDASIRSAEDPLRKYKQAAPISHTSRSLPGAVKALERRMIEETLRESGGNKPKAAPTSGLSRQGLNKKLKIGDFIDG